MLTSSRPAHLWSSRRRWRPQKCPLQKPQSPTMRWAASLQSLAPQRIFFPGMMVVVVVVVDLGLGLVGFVSSQVVWRAVVRVSRLKQRRVTMLLDSFGCKKKGAG